MSGRSCDVTGFRADRAAAFLVPHFLERTQGVRAGPGPASRADAYATQDFMIAALGGGCGWKVGRAKDDPEPYCAPLPLTRLLGSGGTYRRSNGVALVEAELGFRLGRDVPAGAAPGDRAGYAALVDAVVPTLEILETRLSPPAAQDPLWKLADLQANGGVVLGRPVPWEDADLGAVRLALDAGGEAGFEARTHPFGAPFDLFCWTVEHVALRRGGLRRGDVVITGSYCGIVELRRPQRFTATFAGYGSVSVDVV